MEEKDSPPSSYFAVVHGEDHKTLTLCSASEDCRELLVKQVPQQLRGKNFRASCGEWIIVWGGNNTDYSLWNPLTAEILTLPDPDLPPGSNILDRMLTSPPGNPNSMVILFQDSSIRYCRISDLIWNKKKIPDELGDQGVCLHHCFANCNGRIYCGSDNRCRLVVIDFDPDDLYFSICNVPWYKDPRWYMISTFMVESGGELFVIYLKADMNLESCYSVAAIEILRLNIASEEWTRIESFPDRAFFLSHNSGFSCPAPQHGIQGNRIYFQDDDCSGSIYSFNMEDKTVLFLPCPNLKPQLASFWIKSDSRLSNIDGESKVDSGDSREEAKSENGGVIKSATIEGDFGMFGLDIQSAITTCLKLQDYLRFRAVNSWFRSVAPPIRWTKSVLEGSKGYDSLPPWLMFWDVGHSICSFTDPLCDEKYFMTTPPHSEPEDAILFRSKGGWCLVGQGEHGMIIWNPFSKTIIPLPPVSNTCVIAGCGFSSLPDSPRSEVVLLYRHGPLYWIDYIDYTYFSGGWWRRYTFKRNGLKLHGDNHPVFLNGALHFLDNDGKLAILRVSGDAQVDEDGDIILDHVLDSPCKTFHQKFLLECDGKLLSVFVGFVGCFVCTFKLDESSTVWLDVDTLRDHTIYLSGRFSSFSTLTARGMQNRVYFNRFYGKSIVYCSLASKQLHSHDTGEALQNFYNTKEQLLCCWLSPRF